MKVIEEMGRKAQETILVDLYEKFLEWDGLGVYDGSELEIPFGLIK